MLTQTAFKKKSDKAAAQNAVKEKKALKALKKQGKKVINTIVN